LPFVLIARRWVLGRFSRGRINAEPEGRCPARNASRSDAGGHSALQLRRVSTPRDYGRDWVRLDATPGNQRDARLNKETTEEGQDRQQLLAQNLLHKHKIQPALELPADLTEVSDWIETGLAVESEARFVGSIDAGHHRMVARYLSRP
jgi:hypothetical protein